MTRVLIVSNRLPLTLRVEGGDFELARSIGGLATGLAGVHEAGDGLWIGWPGELDDLDSLARIRLERELARRRLVPVHLERDEVEGFYDGFSNQVLWPLFHSLVEHLPLDARDFDAYRRANQRFADAVCATWQPGDVVWVHDYHLMLVPALVRARLPRARIGFFLHIPFPPSPTLRILPEREELLEGLLGADLIGFHTHSYVRHFAASLLRVLGTEIAVDRARWRGREVRIGTFAMGIDAEAYSKLADDPGVLAEARRLKRGGTALLVGIDRLDYTKGIQRRLLAVEQLLKQHPELRGRVSLVQVASPSRTSVQVYRKVREAIDALVGRIQGVFATPDWVPVHYIHRALGPREVTVLYRAADAMLVTPLRDGMNLVAKEFVAARNDEDGVLILSEFAGASSELAEALTVNPFDVDQTAEACFRALAMPKAERAQRMRGMRERVFSHDVGTWAKSFLSVLDELPEANAPTRYSEPRDVEAAAERAFLAPSRVLFVDYDGTLVPFRDDPGSAAPDGDLLALLEGLCSLPDTTVHLVSGRAPADLERWFGELPLRMHAEHGLWTRTPPHNAWQLGTMSALPRREALLSILEDFARRTPGAMVEAKAIGFAWHWRAVEPGIGFRQANELRLLLASLCVNLPVEVHTGDRVIEVRPYGANKGLLARRVLAEAPQDALAVAVGDDRTDEELFESLPTGSISVHVGPSPSAAEIRLADYRDARRFLSRLCAVAR